MCLLIDGDVEIVKSAGKRQQMLTHYHAGDYFGEISVLDGGGRSTAARAMCEVVMVKIPREQFLSVLESEPVALTLALFQRVLAALRHTNELFVREVVHKEKLSLVGEMAGSLMHDLRNPVTGIGLAADLITMNHSDGETVKSCDAIRLQCDRVVAMAQELLEFSRDETKLQLRSTTTTKFLDQFYSLNEDFFNQAQVEIVVQAEPADIRIDTMRVLRLLQNLVTNAIEALEGRPDARIEIQAWAREEVLYLRVADNGPGLPEEVRSHIFEPFVTHGKQKGIGLGMSIVRNIVVAHGGTIEFESDPEKGTTFTIELPQHSKTQQLPMLQPR
jgi:signal transduction histidine kinase